jgi:hypothetical protein
MSPKKTPPTDKLEQMNAELRREREQRAKAYRERALKLFPWICARCGREFSGKKIRELTVHHKDQNHDNNPPDGGNWELLCLYCHDNEHSRSADAEWYGGQAPPAKKEPSVTFKPFADLESLLKKKK